MSLFAEYRPEARGTGSPSDLFLRPAVGSDLSAVTQLRLERGDATAEECRPWFARRQERARAEEGLLLVACAGDAVVGYGCVDRLLPSTIPEGWYLGGLIVSPALRRRGIGARLTADRLVWIARRAPVAYYFANARNQPTIDLHASHGFREVARGIQVPGVTFSGGGVGILFRADLVPPTG